MTVSDHDVAVSHSKYEDLRKAGTLSSTTATNSGLASAASFETGRQYDDYVPKNGKSIKRGRGNTGH
jgi:hypothetical protein